MIRKVGVQLFLVLEGKLLLILRDDKPDIKVDPENGIHNPNTWALPGGGVEENENIVDTAHRELFEELKIRTRLYTLGVSLRGNGYFFGEINRRTASKIVLGEGQRYDFFRPREFKGLTLGGAIKFLYEDYPVAIGRMVTTGRPVAGEELGMATWSGPTAAVQVA